MWSLLPRKYQLLIIVGSGVLIAWSYEWLDAHFSGNAPGVLHSISIAATIIGALLVWFVEWAWRWLWQKIPRLNKWIFPDLNGVWEGTLNSTWVNPATGATVPPIPVKITIRQRIFSASVSLKTAESQSYSTRVFLEAFRERKCFRIWYAYSNEPLAAVRDRSAPHEGVAFLEMNLDENSERLTGRYYTARRTTGDIDVKRS